MSDVPSRVTEPNQIAGESLVTEPDTPIEVANEVHYPLAASATEVTV